MPNHHRGEIEAEIGGRKRILVLTLGALAELESAFGDGDLVALAERFAQGRMSARDLIRIQYHGIRSRSSFARSWFASEARPECRPPATRRHHADVTMQRWHRSAIRVRQIAREEHP